MTGWIAKHSAVITGNNRPWATKVPVSEVYKVAMANDERGGGVEFRVNETSWRERPMLGKAEKFS